MGLSYQEHLHRRAPLNWGAIYHFLITGLFNVQEVQKYARALLKNRPGDSAEEEDIVDLTCISQDNTNAATSIVKVLKETDPAEKEAVSTAWRYLIAYLLENPELTKDPLKLKNILWETLSLFDFPPFETDYFTKEIPDDPLPYLQAYLYRETAI